MTNSRLIRMAWSMLLCCILLPARSIAQSSGIVPASYEEIHILGELSQRVHKNFDRLEEQKYQPDHVFLTEQQSGDWPGDTEGRTILGLTLDAQASHRTPKYLDEIIRRIPSNLNQKGYMGTIHEGKAHEQQLSGNGWLLRGLCEYYQWKGLPEVRKTIAGIAHNLFLEAAGQYASYPIDPDKRKQNVGAESGSIAGIEGNWILSTDIGCVFIGMDGLIHAYAILKDKTLKAPIETLIDKFLKVDLTGIKAQTHATLTACRGLVRYAELTGERRYIDEAARRFRLYVDNGMTENYENYNWFDRFETWTEPCAIVDSYMLAMQLWQHTGEAYYLEQAERIYYNAICHTQRRNGGFGCDNCPGLATNTTLLGVHADEAHWCCTMRGGEGLSCAVRYTCFKDKKGVYLTSFRPGRFIMKHGRKNLLDFSVDTHYPFGSNVVITINKSTAKPTSLHLPALSWIADLEVSLNGEKKKLTAANGFITLTEKFKAGDKITLTFRQRTGFEPVLNKNNTRSTWRRAFSGPLMLGMETNAPVSLPSDARYQQTGEQEWTIVGTGQKLTPVYHLMSPKVWSDTNYHKCILFQ